MTSADGGGSAEGVQPAPAERCLYMPCPASLQLLRACGGVSGTHTQPDGQLQRAMACMAHQPTKGSQDCVQHTHSAALTSTAQCSPEFTPRGAQSLAKVDGNGVCTSACMQAGSGRHLVSTHRAITNKLPLISLAVLTMHTLAGGSHASQAPAYTAVATVAWVTRRRPPCGQPLPSTHPMVAVLATQYLQSYVHSLLPCTLSPTHVLLHWPGGIGYTTCCHQAGPIMLRATWSPDYN